MASFTREAISECLWHHNGRGRLEQAFRDQRVVGLERSAGKVHERPDDRSAANLGNNVVQLIRIVAGIVVLLKPVAESIGRCANTVE
ncbi:hypothetical protein AOQ73_37445 [Bradyrhizobium pachyrhizi]|nr:hypothetical protein AOQ73_37445 [Bradyrhizobium pachyrhizi]